MIVERSERRRIRRSRFRLDQPHARKHHTKQRRSSCSPTTCPASLSQRTCQSSIAIRSTRPVNGRETASFAHRARRRTARRSSTQPNSARLSSIEAAAGAARPCPGPGDRHPAARAAYAHRHRPPRAQHRSAALATLATTPGAAHSPGRRLRHTSAAAGAADTRH